MLIKVASSDKHYLHFSTHFKFCLTFKKMHGRTLRESLSSIMGVEEVDQSRLTITPQRKLELEAEQKKLTYFFRFDKFLNFDANLSGYRNEDYDQQTSWFFYFIDIIYVATIFNISHLITKCGQDTKVYVMAASYFTIMFTTRMFFDTFTSILHANGVLHTMIFILYGLGVYCMTVNIAAVTDDISIAAICSGGIGDLSIHEPSFYSLTDLYSQDISSIDLHRMLQSSNSSGSADNTFGSCRQVENFDFGFALSFLFTRSLIFVLFFLYCTVFHHTKDHAKSNSHGHKMSSNSLNRPTVQNTDDGTKQKRDADNDGNNNIELVGSVSSETDHHITATSTSTNNNTTTDASTHATSTTTSAKNTANSSHRAHINKVFVFKIIPLIISCIIMLFTFADFSTVVIFPMVAIIEIIGDIGPELVVNMDGIKPDRHNLEERLGLMFMLVLGETMLGFLVQRGNAVIDAKTYSTLM